MVHPRFSQHARRSLIHARLLAQQYAHAVIDTDHLLVGVWRTEGSFGWRVLYDLQADRYEAEAYVGHLHRSMDKAYELLPYSEAVETALALANDESRWLGHHYIGTEHVLLGIVRSGAGKAPQLLSELKISAIQIQRRVRRLLNEGVTEINLEAARRMTRLSELSRRVLNAAATLAREYHHTAAGLEHLLLVLARERRSVSYKLLAEAGLNVQQLAEDMKHLPTDMRLSARAFDEVLDRAVDRAEALGTHYTGSDHILLAITLERAGIVLLRRYNVNIDYLQQKLNEIFSK